MKSFVFIHDEQTFLVSAPNKEEAIVAFAAKVKGKYSFFPTATVEDFKDDIEQGNIELLCDVIKL